MSNGFSLSDLDATKASEESFEFEYITPNGVQSGLFLSVYGSQCERVTSEVVRLTNDRRRKEAARQTAAKMRNRQQAEFEPVESDIEFGQRIAAVRLAGWRGQGQTEGLTEDQKKRFRGMTEPFNAENALKLCRINRDIAAQITERSDDLGNFMKL